IRRLAKLDCTTTGACTAPASSAAVARYPFRQDREAFVCSRVTRSCSVERACECESRRPLRSAPSEPRGFSARLFPTGRAPPISLRPFSKGLADETFSGVEASRSLVAGDLRIRTERSRAHDG